MKNWEQQYLHRNEDSESEYFNQTDEDSGVDFVECSECFEDMSNQNHNDDLAICEDCRNDCINKLQE